MTEQSLAGDQQIRQVATALNRARAAVAFTGAGMSTESGLPDFRSPGGVWATNRQIYFDEFRRSAEARQEYWRQKALTHHEFVRSEPNVGHRLLAEWGREGRIAAVITQNIDGLHTLAGSDPVLELHGTARKVACLDCHARFDADPWVARFEAEQQVPDCPECGGQLKHATVSFGQPLPTDILERAVQLARNSDLFLAMGSSLVVEPAASLPRIARQRGAQLVIINREPTPLDAWAHVVIRGSIGETLQAVEQHRRSAAATEDESAEGTAPRTR